MFSDSALPVLNGVSVSVDALVSELRRQGHSVHLFAPRVAGHVDPDPNTYRFRSLETPWSRGYPVAIPPVYRMLRKFRRHEFDVIHTHTPFMLGMVGLRWSESHEVPIVSTYHTLYDRYAHYPPLLPRRYVRFRIAKHTNFYYNQIAHVLTPSEAALKWLRRHSVSTPATIVPTGSPARRMLDRSETRHRLGIAPHERILLYVGRLALEKNLPVLFEMAARVFARDASYRLWLVGDGPYRAECATLARELGIGDRVRFVGFVPRAEVDDYYAVSDLFVFSSITETQGLVVQEAMTYGLPAVAVAGGGASSCIVDGENGFVVRNDAYSFAEKVLELLENDTVYARLAEGASRSVRGFGISEMGSQVVEVYREVIRERRNSAYPPRYAWV